MIRRALRPIGQNDGRRLRALGEPLVTAIFSFLMPAASMRLSLAFSLFPKWRSLGSFDPEVSLQSVLIVDS